MKGWCVALLYNLKHHVPLDPGAPADALAEYDSEETVQAIEEALRAGGHEVISLEADVTLLDTIREARPDICFNIAEGHRGDARESQVPALLELLGIPYTGSKVLAHALSLDKAAAKHLWRDVGLPTAPFQVFQRAHDPLDPRLPFPLFVKPVREGTGMGINHRSVVHTEPQLREQVAWVLHTYRQPALVESYLPGREFTVGLLGNSPVYRQELWRGPGRPERNGFYAADGFHVFPVLEIDVSPVPEAGGLYSSHVKSELPLAPRYLCPAPIREALAEELRQLAVEAFLTIGGLDVGRVDFRLDAEGRPHLLEINTLPGLNPTYSDLCIMARAEGVEYAHLINEILDLAAERYRLKESRPRTIRAGW